MDMDTESDLETKASFSPDRPMTYGEFMSAFDEFKASNEDRLAQIERRGAADPLTEDKQARIDAAIQRQLDRQQQQINELTLKQARPAFARDGASASSFAARERKAAFEAYVRRGDSAALRELEVKALSVGSGPDGGYLVPPEVEQAIGRRLAAISPIRSLASVRVVSANVYKKPFMTSGPAVGWVGETDARPQTNSPVLDELNFPVMELYAMPAATPTLLDDAAVNIDEWIASEVELAFATQEGTAFVTGDGVNKPKGFLSYTTVANELVAVEQDRLFRDRRGRRVPCIQSFRRAGRPHLFAEGRLSPERRVRDEPQDAERDPQVQGHDRPVSVAAAGAGRRAREPAHLPGDRVGGHARHRDGRICDRFRRFHPRLSRGRPRRRQRAARSLQRQALRAVLHHQARGRRRAGF